MLARVVEALGHLEEHIRDVVQHHRERAHAREAHVPAAGDDRECDAVVDEERNEVGADEVEEEEGGETKKVEVEKVKTEERNVEKKEEMCPKEEKIGMEEMGGSRAERKAVGVESEEKESREENEIKARVQQENKTKEKSLEEKGESPEGKGKGKYGNKGDPMTTISEETKQKNPDEVSSKLVNSND